MQSTATGSHLIFLNINMHVVTYNVCYYLHHIVACPAEWFWHPVVVKSWGYNGLQ